MDGLFGKYKVILAPMAGVTDIVFRQLCKEQGADLVFTEMVSAKGLSYANDKTRHLIDISPIENEVAVQLFGHEPETMAYEAEWVRDQLGDRLAFIDVNMGCPARKIVKKGDGSALMKDPDLAAEIISSIKKAVEVPVTAKFRRGYFDGKETASEFAKSLENAGVDAVTVHGRYATQMYHGESDNECIARVKEAVTVPVVGNGDVKNAADAREMLEETGCDAIMIARASLGNPWVFKDVRRAFDSEYVEIEALSSSPKVEDRLSMMKRHAKMLDESENLNVKKMRKLAPFYIKGIDGAAKARGALSQCSTYEDFKAVANEISSRV